MLIFAYSLSSPLDILFTSTPAGNFREYAENHLFHLFMFSHQEAASEESLPVQLYQ